MGANTSWAVMQQRHEAPDSLDFFPTPPWATRALMEQVLKDRLAYIAADSVWEPACGEGHMAEILKEFFASVHASDIHDYGRGYAVGDFTGTLFRAECPFAPDWIITNPPFNVAVDFVERALGEARRGVAMLLRLAWLEGGERWRRMFTRRPPTVVAVFSGRVAMVKGRWDPEASSATAYAWFVWDNSTPLATPTLQWISPGAEAELTAETDRRFHAATFEVAP